MNDKKDKANLTGERAATVLAEPTPSERVVAQFRRWVQEGVLPPGKELPSERELARDLGTTRAVARLAMGRLEQEGLIERVSPRRRQIKKRDNGRARPPSLRKTLGVIVDDDFRHVPHQRTEGGWRHLVYQGAMDAVLDKGYAPLLIPIGLLTEGSELSAPAGLIVVCRLPGRILANAFLTVSEEAPLLAAYGDHQDWPNCDTVLSDHAEGARQLVVWLAGQGRCRPLLCHEPSSIGTPWLAQRETGYRKACAELGLEALSPEVIERLPRADYEESLFKESVRFVAGQLRRHLQGPGPVDALMAVSDGMVPQLTAACRLLGVERQVLIVGYDNYWAECPGRRHEPTPPAATIDKKNYLIGQTLGDLLHRRLAGEAPAEPVRSRVMPLLVSPVLSEPSVTNLRPAEAPP